MRWIYPVCLYVGQPMRYLYISQMDMRSYLVEQVLLGRTFTQIMTSKLWYKCRASIKVSREELLELTNCTPDHLKISEYDRKMQINPRHCEEEPQITNLIRHQEDNLSEATSSLFFVKMNTN